MRCGWIGRWAAVLLVTRLPLVIATGAPAVAALTPAGAVGEGQVSVATAVASGTGDPVPARPEPFEVRPAPAGGPASPSSATDAPAVGVVNRPPSPSVVTTSVGPAMADAFEARLGPLSSTDAGEHCALGLDAVALSRFFAEPIGRFQGADYQRAIRLPDDRVLWTFQDAFVDGRLVHNVAMIQSGRCFSLLDGGRGSWLLDDLTVPRRTWQWILGGGLGADGAQLHLFVVEMSETGGTYLERPRPTGLRRVVLDATTLDTIEVVDEADRGDDLYGWSVTSDATYTYLYAHCYQQFGYDTTFGFAPCSADVKLARVPLGRFDDDYEFWDGVGWSSDHRDAAPVVDGRFVMSGNNPAQIRYTGDGFALVEKRDDWWGTTVEFGVADRPQGPFTHVASVEAPLTCEPSICNSYFASWVPWNDTEGTPIWSIGHNRWDGTETWNHLDDYRPSFATLRLPSADSTRR